MTPIQEIQAERHRQIQVEGWTAEHDDEHDGGEMLTAAVIYYQHAMRAPLTIRADGAPMGWPWDAQWWKPKDRRRDLVRAGALCLAERERIRRRETAKRGRHGARLVRSGAYTGHVDQKLNLIVAALMDDLSKVTP